MYNFYIHDKKEKYEENLINKNKSEIIHLAKHYSKEMN